ncbi:hypothetical protein F3Y22_tig00110597pilonHSYRG00634 [Hibiscus syriacus]|uniref:RNase H type-1 domain-containing protein n=1 Tax=Hibiscus syriacus TaxID=106335 RepID=A0A6A3A657_HIBSY|nr:hypothetical protein F3Y22_tig00110597pilonHSYRG00634 [Hibiscus syriacus]
MELDDKWVVELLNADSTEETSDEILLSDCKELLKGGWIREVRHMWREGNKCVDRLVNLAVTQAETLTILQAPSDEVNQLLEADRRGLSTLMWRLVHWNPLELVGIGIQFHHFLMFGSSFQKGDWNPIPSSERK